MADRRIIATKEDWEIFPMPSKTATFTIKRHFTEEEIENLKAGHIPEEMEDRWFSYFEDNKLYIHRSWSGICVYIVEFNFKSSFLFKFKEDKHNVTVNRDVNQYACTNIDEDIEELNSLLNYFSYKSNIRLSNR